MYKSIEETGHAYTCSVKFYLLNYYVLIPILLYFNPNSIHSLISAFVLLIHVITITKYFILGLWYESDVASHDKNGAW